MAHIVSTLGNADFGRQVDIYKLARMTRDRKCENLWTDYAKADPNGARLVVSYVEEQQRTRDNASSIIDGVLVKARKKKTRKTAKATLTKAQKTAAKSRPVDTGRARLEMMLTSRDPWVRETARNLLGK